MNWKRGLFRVWVVLTCLWIGILVFDKYDAIQDDLSAVVVLPMRDADKAVMVPVSCYEQSAYGADLVRHEALGKVYCAVREPRFIGQNAEQDRHERLLIAHRLHGPPVKGEYLTMRALAPYVFGPPFVVLGLGLGVAWTLSGFRRPRVA
jgi:hypothetical protein